MARARVHLWKILTRVARRTDLRASAGKILQLASSIRKSLTNVEAQSSRGAAARDGSIRSEVARLEKELERKRALKAQFEADVARWQKRFEALCQKNRAVSKQVLPVDSGLPLGGSPKPPGARRGRAPSPAQRL